MDKEQQGPGQSTKENGKKIAVGSREELKNRDWEMDRGTQR